MLSTVKELRRPKAQGGFSLVEMMVALVLGLVVVAAVIALIVAIMKSNNQNIQSTRLMQELRSTAAVIGADVRRSRSVLDPLVTATATAGNPYKNVDTNTAGCIRYGYDGGASGPYRVIYRDTANNKVMTAGGATPADAACTSTGIPLTSNQVQITALTFTRLPLDAGGNQPPIGRVREIQMTITGQLVNADPGLAGISRTITQSIFIRSIGDGS